MFTLEKVVVPSLDALNKLQAEKRILAGGLKVGERAFVFVAEAESNVGIVVWLQTLIDLPS